MAKTELQADDVTRTYMATLQIYLYCGEEAALHRAYEIGRRCLGDGRSILEMISIHHRAMQGLRNGAATSQLQPETVKKAGEFFTECMSPFEMTRRAIGEANLALRMLNEALEEQVRLIARELHDQSGQLLAAVHIALDELARDLPEDRRPRLQGVKDLCDQVEKQLRGLSHELRPTILEDLGLTAALESLAELTSKRTAVRITVVPFEGARLASRVEVALYRIVQEALNNVVKHASATSAEIKLSKIGTALRCSIVDNGIGFDTKALQSDPWRRGLGLSGIRERVRALEGELQIESSPGRGTRLEIMIPLEG
jgi:two-component system sensor histidine kinase DegS